MTEKSLRQSFSHLFQEETHLQDVETVGVIRHTPVFDIQIIHAGGEKNCIQCINRLGKILFARVDVERYLAHGSALHFVKLVFGEQGRKLPLTVSTAYLPAFVLKTHLHLFHVEQLLIHVPSGIKIKEIFVVARFEAML